MASRRPTRAEQNRVIRIDLAADWHPFAPSLPAPASDYDWRYCGTITIDGETGGLAWHLGGYGIGTALGVRELGLWDRIKINAILQGKPPGSDRIPHFPDPPMSRTP